MKVIHSRIQHGVGQGSFHSASVEVVEASGRRHRFDYVYDCGALAGGARTKELTRSIKRLGLEPRVGNPKKAVIDLLVLSHFDKDHMNGAIDLVNKFEVDRIMLPYLTPKQLALVIASQANSITQDFVQQLHSLANGGGRFLGRPATMVQTGPRDRNNFDPDVLNDFPNEPAEIPREGPSTSPDRLQLASFADGAELGQTISDLISLKVTSGAFPCLWKLRFWNRGQDTNLTELVKEKLTNIGFPVAALDDQVNGVKDIVGWLNFKLPKKPKGTSKSLIQKSNRDKALDAYHEAIKELNPTWEDEPEALGLANFLSLGMYSGPGFTGECGYRQLLWNTCDWRRYYFGDEVTGGWIGTGDAPLGESAVWNDFQQHFQFELSQIVTVLIPHHGAAPSTGPSYYNVGLNHVECLNSVISYGKSNNYGHPKTSVLTQIMSTYSYPILVTEDTELGFHEVCTFPA